MASTRPPPTWPGDASKQTVLGDVLVRLPLDALFLLLQGGYNDFRKKLEALNSHMDYRSTGWIAPPLPTAELSPTSRPVLTSVSNLRANMVRKTSFVSGKYATTEYGKLLEMGPKRAVVETYVETKAPYGDRFQVMMRNVFEVYPNDSKNDGKKSSATTRMTVTCTIVYTESINGMIRGMIDKGSREGMSKGQQNTLKLLREQAEVTPVEAAGSAPKAAGAVGAAGGDSGKIIYKEHLELLFGKRLVAVLEPYAFLASSLLQQINPSLSVLTPTRIGIVCLTFVSFQAVHLLLDVLTMLEEGASRPAGGRGVVGYGLRLFFRVFRTPSGMHEVFCNFILLVFVRSVFGVLSLGLADPRAKDAKYGTTYSGYKAAIANAEPQYVGIDAKSEFALEQIGKGLDYFASKFKAKEAEVSEQRHRRREKIKEKLKSHRHKGHVHHHRHGGGDGDDRDDGDDGLDDDGIDDDGAGSHHSGSSGSSGHHGGGEPLNDSMEYSAPSLPPERTVVEEIFECQRHQPFRGWGSKWPGHFLPTDQLNRWNVRTAKANGIYTSQNLDDVVPKPPDGWAWVEREWTLDLSGRASGSTDAAGWSYALDFARDIAFPFPPGSGKAKLSDFVRTRRWLRTRALPAREEGGEEGEEGEEAQSGAAAEDANAGLVVGRTAGGDKCHEIDNGVEIDNENVNDDDASSSMTTLRVERKNASLHAATP